MTDIFTEGKQIQTAWAKFENIGDSYQGTYVGQRKAIDSYSNPQIIYELMGEDGTIINVGVKETKTNLIKQMSHINYGQIVGFKFTEQIPNKNQPGKMINIVNVFADSSIKNERWLVEQAEQAALRGGDQEMTAVDLNKPITTTAPPVSAGSSQPVQPLTVGTVRPAPAVMTTAQTPDVPFESQPTDTDKLKTISELAQAKLGVTDPASVKDEVMGLTKLAFISSNLDQMITILRSL